MRLLAYTSLLHADRSPLGWLPNTWRTEKPPARVGGPYGLLRNGWYSENRSLPFPPPWLMARCWLRAQEGRIASGGARGLCGGRGGGTHDRKPERAGIYELAGDAAYTLTELAAVKPLFSPARISTYTDLAAGGF